MENQMALTEAEQSNELRICSLCSTSLLHTRCCNSCSNAYCAHQASKIDPQYCVYCHHDVVLHDTTITKDIVTKSYSGKKTFHRTMKARHLVFEGQDWMLAQRRITTLNDMEVSTMIEYHREILAMMLEEREKRRIQNNQKQIRKGLVFKSKSITDPNSPEHGLDVQSATVTTVKVTKTKVVSSAPDPQLALKAIMNVFRAQGFTDEQIKQKIMSMAGKK